MRGRKEERERGRMVREVLQVVVQRVRVGKVVRKTRVILVNLVREQKVRVRRLQRQKLSACLASLTC